MGFSVAPTNILEELKDRSMLTVNGTPMSYAALETPDPANPFRFEVGKKYDMEMTKHAFEDSAFFWQVVLAFLMDWAIIAFCFNMLPIITLDGADFFGSWVRLCSTPMVSAIFIICTSFICLILLGIFEMLLPLLDILKRWDGFKISEDKNVKGEQ